MKRYDEYSRHLEVLKRAPQEDLTNEFIISGIVDNFCMNIFMHLKKCD